MDIRPLWFDKKNRAKRARANWNQRKRKLTRWKTVCAHAAIFSREIELSQFVADYQILKNARIKYILILTFLINVQKKPIPCFSEVCTVQGVVTLESPVEWCLPGGVCFLEPVNENGILKSEANIIQLRVQDMTRTKVKIMLKEHKNNPQNP